MRIVKIIKNRQGRNQVAGLYFFGIDFYKLLLNLLLLSALGLLLWSGIKLFGEHAFSAGTGSVVFITSLVFFILLWVRVKRNRWRRVPGMKLTIVCLVGLFVITAFAGCPPMATYKDEAVEKVTAFFDERKEEAAAKLAQIEKAETELAQKEKEQEELLDEELLGGDTTRMRANDEIRIISIDLVGVQGMERKATMLVEYNDKTFPEEAYYITLIVKTSDGDQFSIGTQEIQWRYIPGEHPEDRKQTKDFGNAEFNSWVDANADLPISKRSKIIGYVTIVERQIEEEQDEQVLAPIPTATYEGDQQ